MDKTWKSWDPGNIVSIDLGDGSRSFARVLKQPLLAFYDLKAEADLEPEVVVATEVLFKIWVVKYALSSGRWKTIGCLPLEREISEPPTFFKQDPVDKSLSLYVEGEEHPASLADCVGLERAAVWDPEQVEDRLRDHFAGRPNCWVESLKPSVA